MKTSLNLILPERIQQQIFLLRGQKVVLSPNLAQLYGVPVKALNQAVRRNRDRFPEDFMFQLNRVEFENLKSQIVTSSWGGARRALAQEKEESGLRTKTLSYGARKMTMPASQPHFGITIVTCAKGEMRASADGVLVYDRDGRREG